MSPFVVPIKNLPLIWPSNGKIIRGPYQYFLNPTLIEGFDYVNMTDCSYLLLLVIEDLKLYVLLSMLWLWWLVIDLIYHFWYYEFFGGWIYLLLDSFWWYVHCWSLLSLYLSFRSLPSCLSLSTLFTLPMTLFTVQMVVIFDLSNDLIFTRLVS